VRQSHHGTPALGERGAAVGCCRTTPTTSRIRSGYRSRDGNSRPPSNRRPAHQEEVEESHCIQEERWRQERRSYCGRMRRMTGRTKALEGREEVAWNGYNVTDRSPALLLR
jgi:hypothetical protein